MTAKSIESDFFSFLSKWKEEGQVAKSLKVLLYVLAREEVLCLSPVGASVYGVPEVIYKR